MCFEAQGLRVMEVVGVLHDHNWSHVTAMEGLRIPLCDVVMLYWA